LDTVIAAFKSENRIGRSEQWRVECLGADDAVFTVEYSIRSAQTMVYSLFGLDRKAPPVYKGQFNPRVLLEAFPALHEIGVQVRQRSSRRVRQHQLPLPADGLRP